MGWRMLICIGYKYNLMVLLPAGARHIYTHMFMQQAAVEHNSLNGGGKGGRGSEACVAFLCSLAILFRFVRFARAELGENALALPYT